MGNVVIANTRLGGIVVDENILGHKGDRKTREMIITDPILFVKPYQTQDGYAGSYACIYRLSTSVFPLSNYRARLAYL